MLKCLIRSKLPMLIGCLLLAGFSACVTYNGGFQGKSGFVSKNVSLPFGILSGPVYCERVGNKTKCD